MPERMEPDVLSKETPTGSTGVQLLGGTLFRMEDYNSDLQGQRGTLVYEKMRRGDPDVASGLAKLTWPILSVPWVFEPAADTDEDREAAEYCEKWIFGKGRRDPFAMNQQAFLRHALLMLSDGFSAFEKVWGRDSEGHDVYADLIPVLPKTIVEFQFSDVPGGGLEYARQRAWIQGQGFAEAKIRAEKLALFVFGREGNNLFGWPILRAAYKPWFHKEIIEVIDGIRIERNGVGFTVITIPRGSTAKVRDAAKAVASQIRVHERQGVIVEEGTKVEILYPSGSDPKIVDSLNFLRSQILEVLMSEFVEHGTGNVGSKALVSSKIELQLYSLQSVVSDICDAVDRFLTTDLIWKRWGNKLKPPRCTCPEIAQMSAGQLAEVLSKLGPAGFLDADPEIKQHVRKSAKLPLIPEKDMKRLREQHDKELDAKVKMAGQPQPAMSAPSPAPGGNVPPSSPPKEAARRQAAIAPGPFWRDLLPHEASADFKAMKSHLITAPKAIYAKYVKPMRETMAWVAAGRVTAMSDSEVAKGRVAIPNQAKLSKQLEEPFLKTYAIGRDSILAERERQLAAAVTAQAEDDTEDEFPTEPTKSQAAWIAALAAGFVTGMLKAMEKRAIDEALTARQAELKDAEQKQRIYEAILGLSENVLQAELAGDLNRAFATGRNDQAAAMGDAVETAYYSAVMDDSVCEPCSLLDGEEHEPGDPDYTTPNKDCFGGAYCRCVTIYVFRAAESKEAA